METWLFGTRFRSAVLIVGLSPACASKGEDEFWLDSDFCNAAADNPETGSVTTGEIGGDYVPSNAHFGWDYAGSLDSGADKIVTHIDFYLDMSDFGFATPAPPETCEPIESMEVSFCESEECFSWMHVIATKGEPIPVYDDDEGWDGVDIFNLDSGSALATIDWNPGTQCSVADVRLSLTDVVMSCGYTDPDCMDDRPLRFDCELRPPR
jgi:hypothetical protein